MKLIEGSTDADVGTNLLDTANALNLAGRYEEAEKIYDQLLTQNHDNAGLLAIMGTLQLQMGKVGLAISLLERATVTRQEGDVYCNLGVAYKQAGQYENCREAFSKAMKFNPSAGAMAAYSALFVNIARPDEAIKWAAKALKADPECAMAHWNKGMAHLEKGEWRQGWEHCEWGFESKPRMRVRRKIDDKPYWDGTNGKTIAVYGEQGLGDEIMFASMLPEMMEKNTVIYECHPRLQTLFEKSFPGLQCYGTRDQPMVSWPDSHKLDYAVSIGSLGKWYRNNRSDFPGTPYLKADSLPRGNKFRVGISWTGGLKEGRVRTRSVPLAGWQSILNNRDCEFVSLQYTDSDAEIDTVNSMGYDIKKAPEAKASDYYETARLVKSCDLVISCCTSVIHLAGALGVPCWVMVPNKPAWRYGVSGGMPWYQSVRLYRQPEQLVGWSGVVDRIGFDLSELLASNQRMVA
jgi:Tfp pilus assembly protein PilF